MKLRKVLFNRWIPRVVEKTEYGGSVIKEGTNCWEKGFSNAGFFHQWDNECVEGNENYGNYTVAIVELPDGTIEKVEPQNIKFIENN